MRYSESHNDDVVELDFHPEQSSILLSGSTDGLVNIYDTSLADEDDVLIHVFNHGSSVSHAGYLANDQIYALSHDEIFSMYTIGDADSSDSQERQDFGDLRPRLDCEYVVDMMHSSSPLEALTGAGSHR